MKRILFGFFLFLGAFLLYWHPTQAQENQFVNRVKIEDYVINPVVSEYLSGAIKTSQTNGAQCLIIELDTPGGLLSTTRNIVKEMMNAEVPIVVYVAPSGARAGSAGVFITLASHIAAMAPSTNIGAAHPVDLGQQPKKGDEKSVQKFLDRLVSADKKPATKEESVQKEEDFKSSDSPMRDKILNDTVAWVRGIAKARGRNQEWAVQAVVESLSSEESEALENGVVEFVCADVEELLQKINGLTVELPNKTVTLQTQNAAVKEIPMTKRQSILNVLSNPNIAYILMMLGFYGLLYEITHPGFGVPGIAGVICLVIAFYSLQTLPVNYAGLILILLAIGLFVAEAMVASFGLFALGGVIAMLLGSLMLIDSPASFMRVSLKYILPIVASTAGVTILLVSLVVRSHRRKVSTGQEGLIGEEGVAEVDLSPGKEGTVFVHGEIWTAESESSINKGNKIKIVAVQGMHLKVEQV